MSDRTYQNRILRYYFLSSASVGILACLILINIGWQIVAGEFSSSKVSWLLSFSTVAAFSIIFAVLAGIVFQTRDENKRQASLLEWFDRRGTQVSLTITGLLLYAVGAIFLFSASPELHGPTYPVQLIPFFIWMAGLGLITALYITLYKSREAVNPVITLILLMVILTAGILVNLRFWSYESPRQEDIYFIYLDGARLSEGSNPYEIVLAGDMRVNDKYSTYLPGFYYLSSGIQRLGLSVFAEWLSFWRIIFLLSNLAIAALLFYIPDRQNLTALSVFSALFWLFNRWTLHVSKTADIDFLPLFLLLLSLYLYRRNAVASYLILGLSLVIKQMAVFLVPLFLIWTWQDSQQSERLKRLSAAIVLIGIIPLLASIPFLVWNWEGFLRSILFSATRDAAALFSIYSLDAVLGLRGIPARLPLLVMLAIVYWLTWKYAIDLYLPAFLTMAVFVFFNSVFYTSYMIWAAALIPLVVYEYVGNNR